MATPKHMLQLLFLGALVSPVFLQQEHPCTVIKRTFPEGPYHLDVTPNFYKPGETYTVSINGVHNATSVILQAVSSGSNSSGRWESENQPLSCGNESIVQKNISSSSIRTRWMSPTSTSMESVQIRAFVSFANGTVLLQSRTLSKEATTVVITPPPSTTAHSATGSHKPTVHSHFANTHIHNSTILHHNGATAGNSASAVQTGSFLLAAVQLFSTFLGYKIVS